MTQDSFVKANFLAFADIRDVFFTQLVYAAALSKQAVRRRSGYEPYRLVNMMPISVT